MISRTKLSFAAASIALVGGFALTQALANPAAAPAAQPAAAPMAPAPATPLTDVQDKKILVGAKVKDNKGEAVGEVKGVQVGADGKIAAVDVTVGNKTVAIAANTLTYAQADNTLVSSQSKAEITGAK